MIKERILIPCAKGVTAILAEEVRGLGFEVVKEHPAAVETLGSFDDTLKLNLHLRTAQRVLFLLAEFEAGSADDMYAGVRNLPWEDWFFIEGYFCITSSVDAPSIKDSRFANLRCKDAIADRFMEKKGKRPDSGPKRDQAVVFIYWKGTSCSIYIDTSGEGLYMRTYRKLPWKAPMQEALAAAVIMATGWNTTGNFVNPMCGSGTLAIEAALMATGRAPGMLRSNFGFMHVRKFNEKIWNRLKADAVSKVVKRPSVRIIATDNHSDAVSAARKNAAAAGVEDIVEFDVCDYADTYIPIAGGVVLLNPEYGERLGEAENLGATYRGIGDFFKKKCAGYTGAIFTGNLDLAKQVGLKPRRRIPLYNASIDCRLLLYDLYEGSRQQS